MAKKTVKTEAEKKEEAGLKDTMVKQLLTLATSGFGVVAALAWNEAIKEMVNVYIKPYTPKGSGVIPMVTYALIVTTIAVIVTYNLTRLLKKKS
jgi:ABC-type uncharacterized transport system fused permease/ATPase subunit